MIISRTPLRLPLGGGGTDLPSYSSRRGGFVLTAAIDKYQFITVNRRRLDRLIRASYSKTETVASVAEVEHNIIREALRLVGIDGGIEISSIADVPGSSGLGSSGAFTVGLLAALHTLKRETVAVETLVEEACHIEIDVLRQPIGKQDQYIAGFGGIQCLDIDPRGTVTVTPLPIDASGVEDLEHNVLLFYTGVGRNASDVLADQDRATADGDAGALERLDRIKEIGLETRKVLERGELRRFGELLHEHWSVKRSLSAKVSSDAIDRWYATGRAAGAIGGKLVGAGGGGFFMFYIEEGQGRLRAAMAAEGLLEMRFRFEPDGTKIVANI